MWLDESSGTYRLSAKIRQPLHERGAQFTFLVKRAISVLEYFERKNLQSIGSFLQRERVIWVEHLQNAQVCILREDAWNVISLLKIVVNFIANFTAGVSPWILPKFVETENSSDNFEDKILGVEPFNVDT